MADRRGGEVNGKEANRVRGCAEAVEAGDAMIHRGTFAFGLKM